MFLIIGHSPLALLVTRHGTDHSMLEQLKAEAQQILDELLTANLIPFKLSVSQVEWIGPEEYIVRFHDSPLRAVDVSWGSGQCFCDALCAVVLERVKRMSGPGKR